jgi:hypothetical protein
MPDPVPTPDPHPPDGTKEVGSGLPHGEALAAWTRALAPRSPTRLWFARLTFCHVETLVAVARPFEPDPLQRAVLRGLGVTATPPERLRLDSQVLGRVLRELSDAGLVERDPGGVRLSPRAARGLAEDRLSALEYGRRLFSFLDNTPLHRPPSFLLLKSPTDIGTGPLPEVMEALRECISRPAEWKAEHGFPPEVESVCAPGPDDWRGVVVAYRETASFLLTEAGEKLLGFDVGSQGEVEVGSPRFALSAWRDAFADLEADIPPEAWREAWQGWCRDVDGGLSAEEADACACEPIEGRLVVRVPGPLRERFRSVTETAPQVLVAQGPRAWAVVEVTAAEG